MMNSLLSEHATLSRMYGLDARFVLLGGGNTSVKTGETLYIKPSGVALSEIQPEQFVALERKAIRQVFEAEMPDDCWAREARVKEIMAAAVRPLGAGRPSVEAPLHEVIRYRYVYHMHPALVNGMTCAKEGAEACARLFPDAMWIETTDPGYTLAAVVKERLDAWCADGRAQPQTIFLQNHGVFVGADDLAEIDRVYERIMSTLEQVYHDAGVSTELAPEARDDAAVLEIAPTLRTLLGTPEKRALVCCSGYFAPSSGPLSPDHIVYAKSYAFLGEVTAEALAAFEREHGYAPKVVGVPGKGTFAADAGLKGARGTMLIARDAALVEQLTAAFGGPLLLTDQARGFIENWEVEQYRRKVAAGAGAAERAKDKVCVVTGGAQGFGLGIAKGLLTQGAIVFLADVNLDGARRAAGDLQAEFGSDRVMAVEVNIADEASVQSMVRAIVQECGGVDVFIANAGVLRAGSVKELEKRDWDLVTNVNYTGYFLCTKHVARVMAVQNGVGNGPWTDIVQINSKSGLEGSNRNGAYAGGKFGGIGLTQSFAMELVEDHIKVNSICPGNFFDGPLWSDPDRGLFVQYLNTGKVPGAKTLDDVRRFYESKVPMNRGCRPDDVVKAILYVMEQDYETGQAVPVTGGQVMLH